MRPHIGETYYRESYCSETGTPVEKFIQFLDNTGHKAEDMEASIVKILSNLNIVDECRGQSYDNTNNMSGVYSGLQARIKSRNSLAKYVPCAEHSLNLIVQHAAESTMETSTYRWKRITDLLKNGGHTIFVPKRVNVTRWSGRFNALKALNLCYQYINQAVLELSSNDDEKMPVRCQANNLHEKMATIEFGIYAAFWIKVLKRTDLANIMDYEKEQKRLLALFEEVSTGEEYYDEEKSGEEDHVEENLDGSDTEQENEELDNETFYHWSIFFGQR
ncbi:uncharacterized protein [Diabrotica undecimpunctata]|uniref:uncharacterized protein n=1 Tax=Diabrotica undecimpunctata TaxID=50387 RepID=UPI003B63FFE2